MSDFIKKQLASLIRLGLGFIAGALTARGIIDAETAVKLAGDATVQQIAGAVTVLVTGLWTAWKNRKEQVKLEKAIAAPAGKAE